MDEHPSLYELRCRGWTIFKEKVSSSLIPVLAQELDKACVACRAARIRNGLDANMEGTAHHLVAFGESLIGVLLLDFGQRLIEQFLGGPILLNSYGGVVNTAGNAAYVGRVHRDVRTYTRDVPLMANVLVMLDDFTHENGATHVLSGSQMVAEKPSDEYFFAHSERLLGRAGDVVVFDSRLWHAAGASNSDQARRALTLTVTRPFFKPQFDYVRLLGDRFFDGAPEPLKQLLGWYSRVPATMDEWYQPPETRFYRREQG